MLKGLQYIWSDEKLCARLFMLDRLPVGGEGDAQGDSWLVDRSFQLLYGNDQRGMSSNESTAYDAGDAPVREAIRRTPGGRTANARIHRPGLRLHPPDNVWEARLSLPQRPRRRVTALPPLDAQGARKTVGLKLTEDELGLYREWIEKQPGTRTAREGNAPHLFAGACPHHRQAGSMNPRVSGSPATVAVTAILRTLRPVR